MSSDQMETEQTTKSVGTRDFVEHLDALDKCGFKHLCRNYKLLKKTGGNFEVVKAFLEAEDKTRKAQKEERKKRRTQEESSSSSSSEEEKPWKKEKREKKEHKKNSKVFKKIQKKDRKEYRNSKSKATDRPINPAIVDLTGNAWPAEGTNLYLDGNNMLFVLGPIRKMALQGQRSEAESVLQGLAEEFSKKMGLTQCTLIYDNTNKSVTTASFVVCSARPQFATSDDALVEWASQPGGKGLYVTSDCGLIERLAAVGSSICKPKQWFAFVANVLSGGQEDNLDGWVQTWIDKRAASISNNNAI